MRLFGIDPLTGAFLLLVSGSVSSCQGTTRYVTERPVASVQPQIDKCVAETGNRACEQLCRSVFGLSPATQVTACNVEAKGEIAEIYYEAPTPEASDPSPSEQGCAPGRRPAGLAYTACVAATEVARYLAWSAQMEAASITAFARVHRDLVALGAPAELLDRVRAALGDEIDHARIMVMLARRYGAQPVAPVIEDVPRRSVLDCAIENAVEGCVNEAVAALHAAALGTTALDPVVRAAFAQIAQDEVQHALLSYDLAAEYARHLDDAGRVRVREAFAAAATRAVSQPVPPALLELGVDAPRLAALTTQLLASLAPRLHS